ncbi:hypothetical protein [Paludisphaera soli]|uniref:hypothetical protein n=1 Tax=Paludisphaera soli TaxID=2712865 RepID=UPI0013EABCB9|nr:hypothetical protein [Paludisphaera soli]
MAKLFGAQKLVLQAIQDSPKDTAGFVTDAQVAQTTGIALKDVRDWIETLEGEGYVEVANAQTGLLASITAKGRLQLSPSEPIAKKPPPTPQANPSPYPPNPVEGRPGVSLLLDEAHGQDRWVGRPTASIGYSRALEGMRGVAPFASNPQSELTREVLDPFTVLVLPVTLRADLTPGECSAIAAWVEEGHGLLALGTYLMERHHETNLNALLRRLGVRLATDLIMSTEKDDYLSCRKQVIGVDRSLAVTTDLRAVPEGHPILDGVRSVTFQSACTVEAEGGADLLVETDAVCSRMRARGRSEDDTDRLILVQDYTVESRGHLPFLVASRAGRGRVIVVGAWKVFLNEFVGDEHTDNDKLFQNCIWWLAGFEGSGGQ